MSGRTSLVLSDVKLGAEVRHRGVFQRETVRKVLVVYPEAESLPARHLAFRWLQLASEQLQQG